MFNTKLYNKKQSKDEILNPNPVLCSQRVTRENDKPNTESIKASGVRRKITTFTEALNGTITIEPEDTTALDYKIKPRINRGFIC